MVETIKITYREGAYRADRPNWDGGEVVPLADYESLERQLAEARAKIDVQRTSKEYAQRCCEAAEAERDRLAADNARLVKASTYFVDRLKDAWLGKIIRDMDEAEAAFIAALAGKE